jgi:hypothetical protein
MSDDLTAQKESLDALMNSATTKVSVDGQSTEFDLAFAEKRRAALERISPTDTRMVRPRMYGINLGSVR